MGVARWIEKRAQDRVTRKLAEDGLIVITEADARAVKAGYKGLTKRVKKELGDQAIETEERDLGRSSIARRRSSYSRSSWSTRSVLSRRSRVVESSTASQRATTLSGSAPATAAPDRHHRERCRGGRSRSSRVSLASWPSRRHRDRLVARPFCAVRAQGGARRCRSGNRGWPCGESGWRVEDEGHSNHGGGPARCPAHRSGDAATYGPNALGRRP